MRDGRGEELLCGMGCEVFVCLAEAIGKLVEGLFWEGVGYGGDEVCDCWCGGGFFCVVSVGVGVGLGLRVCH